MWISLFFRTPLLHTDDSCSDALNTLHWLRSKKSRRVYLEQTQWYQYKNYMLLLEKPPPFVCNIRFLSYIHQMIINPSLLHFLLKSVELSGHIQFCARRNSERLRNAYKKPTKLGDNITCISSIFNTLIFL